MTAVETTQQQESSSSSALAEPLRDAAKQKRSKKKKKHISKHVLKAKSHARDRAVVEGANSSPSMTDDSANNSNNKSRKKKAAANDVVKDPNDACNYLKAWQTKEGWKFNKNTQSWLLRHMYEAEKVSKSTFTILLEYMRGLQGKDSKTRVLEEATARAKRYREYEKAKDEKMNEAEEGEKLEQESDEKAAAASSANADDNDAYGLEHWKSLDDHEKRKEYKRARRVLEVLTTTAES